MLPGNFIAECLYEERVDFISAGATTEDILAAIVQPGKILYTTYVGVENQTTTYTQLVIGLRSADIFKGLFEHENPVPDNIYWSVRGMLVGERERVCARLTGATSGDICVMDVYGWLGYLKKGGS